MRAEAKVSRNEVKILIDVPVNGLGNMVLSGNRYPDARMIENRRTVMVNRIIRNSFGFMAWVVAAIACVIINIMIALANYLGCKSSFELLNYEPQTLGGDGVLGNFFQVFFSEATICNLFALSLNLSEIVGFFLLSHLVFHIYDLLNDRSEYLDRKDKESARIALRLMIRDAILLVILIVPMVCVIRWDLWLFRYRSIAAFLSIEEPGLAAGTIETWKTQLQEQGDLLAPILARIGAWGYISVTAISCLGVEVSARKAGGSWAKLTSAIGEWYAGLGQQNGNGPNAPNPNMAGGDDEDESQNRNLDPSAIDPRDPPFIVEPENDNRERPSVDPSPEEELQPVIGSRSGERVTLAHAIGHPERYWVDPETRDIWDVDSRRELMDN